MSVVPNTRAQEQQEWMKAEFLLLPEEEGIQEIRKSINSMESINSMSSCLKGKFVSESMKMQLTYWM